MVIKTLSISLIIFNGKSHVTLSVLALTIYAVRLRGAKISKKIIIPKYLEQ